MKFKYKKIVLIITMGTMLIGMVIFSVLPSNGGSTTKVEKVKEEVVEGDIKDTTEVAPKVSPAVPASSDGVIKKDLNLEVSDVVKHFVEASVACDMDLLEETVSNISLIDENELKLKYQYVEGVQNIECYMVEGPDGNGYLVYAYRELKLKDIDTLAPGLSRMYVTMGDSGDYRVFFGADTGLEEFIATTDNSKEVVELVDKVNKKLEEATSADTKLKEFINNLTGQNDTNQDQDSQE